MNKFGGLLLIGALALTGCSAVASPALVTSAAEAQSTFDEALSFCDKFSEGINEYTDYVGLLMTEGTSPSVDFLKQEKYVTGLREIAPEDVKLALADFGSVTDQVRAAQSNGGNVTLDSTKFKSGTGAVLAYCAA